MLSLGYQQNNGVFKLAYPSQAHRHESSFYCINAGRAKLQSSGNVTRVAQGSSVSRKCERRHTTSTDAQAEQVERDENFRRRTSRLKILLFRNKNWKLFNVQKKALFCPRIQGYLSLENKLLVYKAVIKPIWTYGIELWGCARKSNVAIIQRSQSKILRTIAKCSLVCNKSYTPYRPQHPLRKWGHQRKNWQTPQQTRIPPQPTSGDTNTTDEQQKTKKTLDLRHSRLRWHRWMVTLSRQHSRTAN